MNKILSEFVNADDLIVEYVYKEKKFEKRFIALVEDINEFIKVSGLVNKVKLNELALGYALVDYFEDIRRLKEFHRIQHVNSIKIVSYTSYWLLRRKPIQLLNQDKDLIYVNERFVLAYIMDFLSSTDKGHLLSRDNSGLKSFSELLFYFLKYRSYGANTLELMLTTFFAGRIYQETQEDLSDKLAKYEKD